MELILPISKKVVTIRPMRGSEEKLILNEKLAKQGRNTDEVLRACILTVDGETLNAAEPASDEFVLKLPSGDRNLIFYHLRILSYGPEMEFDAKCSSCNNQNHYSVDLQELLDQNEVKIVEPGEDAELEKSVELSEGGQAIVTIMDGNRERKIKTAKDLDTVTIAMATLKSLNGGSVTRGGTEKLPAKDLMKIREVSKELIFGLRPDLKVECDECGNQFDTVISQHASFFVPK